MKIPHRAIIAASLVLLMAGCDRGRTKARVSRPTVADFVRSYSIAYYDIGPIEKMSFLYGSISHAEYISSTKTLIMRSGLFDPSHESRPTKIEYKINLAGVSFEKKEVDVYTDVMNRMKKVAGKIYFVEFKEREQGSINNNSDNTYLVRQCYVAFGTQQKADEFIAMLEREQERP